MKIKFNLAKERVVCSYKNDHASLEEAIRILSNPDVIGITITKQTPAQFLKTQRAINDEK